MSNTTTTTTTTPATTSTTAFNTTTTTTSAGQNIAGAIESAVTSNIFNTLSDLYSGNDWWPYTLATYLVTLAIGYFLIFWVWTFVKNVLGGVRDVGSLLTGGKVGGSFEPLPQILDDDLEGKDTRFEIED